MTRRDLLLGYYQAMLAELGPSHWWPGQTPFEIALGAILTQNTAWTNVEKALHNLRVRDLLTAPALQTLSAEDLAELIRPSGAFRVKAVRVGHFLAFLRASCDLDMTGLRSRDMAGLRRDLLGVPGIGPETADSILLYALDMPSFVVDAYTRRILSRHGLVSEDIGYAELRAFFMDALPDDAELFNEFHALIVRTGKAWCAKKQGRCQSCPLSSQLPHPLT
jgi:endonuclease-3 related protein